MNKDSVRLAAQADLILLTVEMFRVPSTQETETAWFEIPVDDLEDALCAGLGEWSTRVIDESSTLTPRSALGDVWRCARELSSDEWNDECGRLFDGATPCPLNQASYVRRDKGTILGDVSAFYFAFGWQGGTDTGERPDHLLCQLEFVAMLLALASRAPDEASYEVSRAALSKFARDHMHDWIPAVCWQMCEESQVEYFGALSQWLLVLWQSLTDLHDWPIDQPASERMKPIVDPDDPYECGAPDLHQIESR